MKKTVEKALSRKRYTYIDGTDICPVCQSRMAGFSYYIYPLPSDKTVSGRAARKAVYEHGEASCGGAGYMCRKCYGRRRRTFFFLLSLAGALSIILLSAGIVFKKLLIGALCVIPPLALLAVAAVTVIRRGRNISDVFDHYTDISCEFVSRFIKEHPEATESKCMVYAEENAGDGS